MKSLIQNDFEDIIKTRELFSRMPVIISEKQKQQLKTFFKMDKHPTTSSFNLANASSQDLHEMIQSGNLPSFLNSFQKNRISELYKSGKTFDSIRKLQSLIDEQNNKPKSFV